MRRMLIFGLMVMPLGYSSVKPVMVSGPALVQRLSARGVSEANTKRIVIVGSKGGFGSNVKVTVSAGFLIREIWDTIYQSRPHKTSCACGFRKLRLYTGEESTEPAAELLVNATDRCHFEGAFDDAFRCPGINKILGPLLKTEYERRQRR